MDPHGENATRPFETPPAGGFGSAASAVWGPMQVLPEGVPLPEPNKHARYAMFCGLASMPGVFLCSVLGIPLAVLAVSFGISGIYRARVHAHAEGRPAAIVGLVTGGLALVGLTMLILFFFVFSDMR